MKPSKYCTWHTNFLDGTKVLLHQCNPIHKQKHIKHSWFVRLRRADTNTLVPKELVTAIHFLYLYIANLQRKNERWSTKNDGHCSVLRQNNWSRCFYLLCLPRWWIFFTSIWVFFSTYFSGKELAQWCFRNRNEFSYHSKRPAGAENIYQIQDEH